MFAASPIFLDPGALYLRRLTTALVFLHGPWGLAWDSFLDDLARSFTVYAPEHPGTGDSK